MECMEGERIGGCKDGGGTKEFGDNALIKEEGT